MLAALRARSQPFARIEADLIAPAGLRSAATARAATDAAGHPDSVLLHLSGDTQVSASIVIRGIPYQGAHGLAGTFGHVPIVPDGVRCACGQRGCLATVAAPAIVLARAELDDFAHVYGRRAAIAELAERIVAAEDRARWAWLDAAHWIGRTLQAVIPTLDPDVVVVGGWWGPFAADIEASFRDNRPTIGGGALDGLPAFTTARPGDPDGYAGARAQARDRLRAVLAASV
ncbi:hypothetical protein GCM10025870_16110 [Agromyces marinus]|uniref:ROK family protein n=1 Tax=Agromyces marinus TaxID=1389020 RepID=A0ABM8H184_9MICO|nr:hypothetical protein GCM10025870_16110 [Agromyces marinus]